MIEQKKETAGMAFRTVNTRHTESDALCINIISQNQLFVKY